MMRTNSDALRIVANSHVDLAKTIIAAKGLRNASMLAIAPAVDREDVADDDYDYEHASPESHPVVELLMPLVKKAVEIVPGLVLGKVMGGGAASSEMKALAMQTPPMSEESDLAHRGFELRDLVDFQYAKSKGDARRAANGEHGGQARGFASLQARIMADPLLVQHLLAIKARLAPDEIDTLMRAVARWSEEQQTEFLTKIKATSGELAVEYCRELVDEIRSHSMH
ncbi:MAG: hypothetical protein WKG01_05455 [Kofleriaceae bacterium]